MKILLVGATGQVGYALASALAKSGHQLTVLVRSASHLRFPDGVLVVRQENFTEAGFASLLPGIDCAIYGVGLPEQFTFDSTIFERVNLNILRSFLQALQQSTLRRLVYISTYDVFKPLNGVIRESHVVSELDGLSPYFRAMTKAYQEVSAFSGKTNVALTTIHPAAVYGGLNTSEGFTNVIENLVNWRLWKLPVVLPGQFPLVHANSLADGIIRALDHQGAYILSDGMYSLKSLARSLRQQARSYVPPEVPAALAYAATAPVEGLGRMLKFRPMLCKVQLDFITSGTEPLADRAVAQLGWTPMSLDAGLKQYLNARNDLLA
jgi:nucleoside-diphosphate-sugar epimerase